MEPKAALAAKIDEVGALQQGNYTDASWAALQSALANAQTVANNATATEEQITTALNALNAAYAGLSENTSSTTYTLTLNPNGGTVMPTTQTGTQGQTYNLPTPTRNNHTFKGWTLSGGGSLNGSTYTFGASNGTVTATWEANTQPPATKGIFGTNAKWYGAWWHYLLFFLCFGFIWMWF